MSKAYEELDYQKTNMGDLILRRRRLLQLGGLDIFEVILGEEFLMSSLFHAVEDALSDLGIAEFKGAPIDVVVGGLGLGYTAVAALKHANVKSLIIVETMEAVIRWHKQEIVPLGKTLNDDKRCRIVHGDFFALAAAPEVGFDPLEPARKFHAILLDIDHTPDRLLHPQHGKFYSEEGIREFSKHLLPGGVFAMWSDEAPDDVFMNTIDQVFLQCQAHVIHFPNPLLNEESSGTVYVARART